MHFWNSPAVTIQALVVCILFAAVAVHLKPEIIKTGQSSHKMYSKNVYDNFKYLYVISPETYPLHLVYIYIYIYIIYIYIVIYIYILRGLNILFNIIWQIKEMLKCKHMQSKIKVPLKLSPPTYIWSIIESIT